jgi:hypothetical protein
VFAFGNKELKKMHYDVLALVQLAGENSELKLDDCNVYLIPKDAVRKGYYRPKELNQYKLCQPVVDGIFAAR